MVCRCFGIGIVRTGTKIDTPGSDDDLVDDLAEHAAIWQDTIRRLEARGDEYKLAPACKINSLDITLTGYAKEYFDIWKAGWDNTEAAKSYEELFSKINDHARRHNLDSPPKKKMLHAGGPIDIRAI